MLDFFLGRRDPTRYWQRAADLELTFALDRAALNTARLGGPLEDALFLGPAEDRRTTRLGIYCYYSLGVCVGTEDRPAITWFEIVYHDEDGRHQPFRGRIVFEGREVVLTGITIERFLERFGKCYWRDNDKDETILFYELPEREWQVEFDAQGVLKRLIVTDQPLMADPPQRAAYGVTKPWPPESAIA
jgi:hypothetical protein